MTESDKPPSPYESMKDDELKGQLEKIAKVLDGRSIDVDLYKMFNLEKAEAVSDDDKKKIEEHSQFMSAFQQVQEIVDGKPPTNEPAPIDPNTEKLANANLATIRDEIAKVDKDFPVDDAINSGKSIFEKIDIANGLKKTAEYHKKTVDGLKESIGKGSGDGSETRSQFSGAGDCDWANDMKSLQGEINSVLKGDEK